MAAPYDPRRLGYSSRGNASPAGETDAPPLAIPNPRAPDTQLETARRNYDASQKEQAALEKKTINAQREADFRTQGVKFYTDSFGNLQPEVDPSGAPRYTTTAWKKSVDEKTGAPVLARRNEAGKTETRQPKVVASGDIKDPNLYYDFGALGKDPAGHVDDLVRHPDPEIARVAAATRLKRNASLRKESLKPLVDAHTAATAELESAQLSRNTLDQQAAEIDQQIAGIDSNPEAKKTTGGVFGIGADPTEEARRLQTQRAALQAKRDELSQQRANLDVSTKKGGALYQKAEQTKLEHDLWANQSKLGEMQDLAEQRRAILRSQKRPEKGDPVLAQILQQQEAYGMRASQAAAQRDTDEKLVASGRAEAAQLDLNPAQFTQRAKAFEARKTLLDEAISRVARDQKGPAAEAQMQSLDAERRALLVEQGRLTGAQEKMIEKQRQERASVIAGISNEELLASIDSVNATLSEKSKRKDAAAGINTKNESAKAKLVARADEDRARVAETADLLEAERKRRGLGLTPGQERADKGFVGDTKDAFKTLGTSALAGAANINRMIAGTVSVGADVTGWDWLRDKANDFSEAQSEVGKQYQPSVSSVDDVDSVASAFKYISGQVGLQAPIFGAAKVAGLMAQGLTRIPQVANLVAKVSGAKKAGDAVEAARKAGTFVEKVSQYGTGIAMETGSIQSDLLDYARDKFNADKKSGVLEGPIEDYRKQYVQPLPILTMGLAAGLAEGFGFGKVMPSGLKKGATDAAQKQLKREIFQVLETDGIGRRVLKSILSAEATEIPTELFQTLAERMAVKMADPDSKYLTGELWKDLKETAAATLVSTAPVGGLEGIRKVSHDSGIEDAVRAIEQFAAMNRNLRDIDQWQHEDFRKPAFSLIPTERITTAAQAAAQAPTPQTAAEIEDIRTRANDSVTVAQQIEAAPDFVSVDEATGQPIVHPATEGANRDAARALVKIANGFLPADLTEAETQALQVIGEQLGSEMLRDVGGQPVITDKARNWALDFVPAASRIIRQTETDRINAVNLAASQETQTTNNHGQEEKGRQDPLLNGNQTAPAAGTTGAVGASVTFTDAAGQKQTTEIPKDATVPSTGAPVTDQATAEQYLAETSKGSVRDVEFSPATQDVKKAADTRAGKEPPRAGTLKPGDIVSHLATKMKAKGAAPKEIATAAVNLSKRVNEAVASRSSLFGGRIEVTDKKHGSGGFLYDTERDTLVVSAPDIANEGDVLTSNPERLDKVIREEAIHRAAVRLEKRGDWKSADLWNSLTPTTREAFVRAYNRGKSESDGARTTDGKAMGHEMVRMLVQGRLAVQEGKLTIDGAAISEETSSPALVQKIADVLRKIRDYFTDLAGQMAKDGNDPKTVAEVNRVVDTVTRTLKALETVNTPAAENPQTNTANSIEGDQLAGEWTKFAPESGTLGVPRTEMPQFKNEHLGALTQFLAARGISHTVEKVLPGTLKPTQLEYSEKKVGNLLKMAEAGKLEERTILVSSDNYVLDRHHMFVAALKNAPDTPVKIIRFNAPIQTLFDVAHDFPNVEYAKGSTSSNTTSPAAPSSSPSITPQSEGAKAPAINKTEISAKIGIPVAQIGNLETVTHKGRTVRTVNVVIEADQANTSHRPDGSVQTGYPQELQPRDRSGGVYLEQQRKIAANPNWSEEMLTGTPDRGTPIMAKVYGELATIIGNGRANAKLLMYGSPDLAETAAKFAKEAEARAPEKGIIPAAVAALRVPVFARVIIDEMSPTELRAFSQASNEFSGAATNAIEQAKVDATRLSPTVLAYFDPEFDLDSAKNDDFRREFVRSVIGRSENITGPDLRRRVQAALFAKAYGDTEAGMAAFSRLAGEDDEGVRNLVRTMLDVAPKIAAMRQQIADGTLHPLDISDSLTRAVQEIAVALREKPAKQSADVALDGLVNQTELAVGTQRDALTDSVLRFLVENRRNRSALTDGLNAYTAGVYAAGDPKQGSMFGFEPPTALDVFNTAATDPQAQERRFAASQMGQLLSSGSGEGQELLQSFEERVSADPNAKAALDDYRQQLDAEVKARQLVWGPWHSRYVDVAPKFNPVALNVGAVENVPSSVRPKVKSPTRIVEKLVNGDGLKSALQFQEGLRELKDALGVTYVIRNRDEAKRVSDRLVRAFGLVAEKGPRVSPKLFIDNPQANQNGYRDDKWRIQFQPEFWAEAILITPRMYEVKNFGIGHAAYEIERTLAVLHAQGALTDSLNEIRKSVNKRVIDAYASAWAEDSVAWLASASATEDQNSASDTSRPLKGNLSTLAPSGPTKNFAPGAQIANRTPSPSSDVPMMKSEPAGGLNLAGASIAPTSTIQGTNRQPLKITSANVSQYAGSADVSPIRGKAGDLWKAFNRSKLDPQAGRLVSVQSLVSPKNELQDPKFLAGQKADPRETAARMMGYAIAGDPRNPQGPRAPLDVTANGDGTFTIIDGNATAQAAMLAGWKVLPVNVRPQTLASGSGQFDLFGTPEGEAAGKAYAAAIPAKAKKSKAAVRNLVAQEVPALAGNKAAVDDLFSFAQEAAPLTNSGANRSEGGATPTNENDPGTTSAPARNNGGRAFTEQESGDLGPLFGDAGSASAQTDAGRTNGATSGNVAGGQQSATDGVRPGEGARADQNGERSDVDQSGLGVGDAGRGLQSDVPSSRDAREQRVDARAAAEARRLARIARYRGLSPTQQNHRITAEDTIVEGGAKTRLRNNVAAIRLLKTLQTENRNATPEEKKVLAKYVGWGALSQAFDKLKGEGINDTIEHKIGLIESYKQSAAQSTWNKDRYNRYIETEEAELRSLESWNRQWGDAYRTLKEILTPEEWDAARSSTENAHYTDRNIIEAIWDGVAHLGFKGGRVLEPAGGVGHFFGLMPEQMMQASELFGVELDTISGGIFKALYPDAQVQVTGFESARLPNNAFDLAISNVPFSENGPVDPAHDKAKLNLHNYFFAKALDKVRAGGVVAFITTSHTMDSSPQQRAYLAERADFIGAIRLPNNAFAGNAGTAVTTDVIFLRKRNGMTVPDWAQAWSTKEKVGEDQIPNVNGEGTKTVPISVNQYFAEHPEMVLGTHSMNGKMYAGPNVNGQYTVNPTEGSLDQKIRTALEKLPTAYAESGETTPITLATTSNAREGAFSYQNGELGIYRDGTWKALAEADPAKFGEGKIKFRRKAAQFVKLRDAYRYHLALMAKASATDEQINTSMAELNRLYDSFVDEWKTLENGRHNELKTDPDFYIVKGLEYVDSGFDENGKPFENVLKSDVLKKRTIFPNTAPVKAENALDALRISQSWRGDLDVDFMADLLGEEPDAVRRQLVDTGLAFENPVSGQLETRENYLSGKVREKLRQAKTAVASNPEYQKNVDALQAVQPDDIAIRHVTPKLGGGWVPPKMLEAFLQQKGFGSIEAKYTQVGESDKWTLKANNYTQNSTANSRTYAGGGYTGLELLQFALDQRTPQVYDTQEKGKRVFNPNKTAAAQAALKRLTEEWEKFAKGDQQITIERDGQPYTATVASITAEAFNEQFNGTTPRVYDGSHLTLPGSAPFLLGDPNKGGMRPHQKNGIWRAIQEGVAFLAHGVGAGKTRELIAIAMEWKRLGLAKKPMLVVHNPTLNQFANETRKIYPGSRVLVATKEDLKKENRRAFAARVASGDWDFVTIAHSSFNLIDDDPAVVRKFVTEQRAEVEAAIMDRLNEIGAKSTEDRAASKDPTVKQLVKQLDALEARLLKASQMANKDDAIYFQELGIDGLLIDEAHMFKKVPFTSKMGSVAGLDMGSSARASNLLMRLNQIREKTKGRNVVLATGTPITNTLAEVWNMIRLTSPKTLKEFGVPTFDQFAASFGKVESSLEMNPAGRWVPRERFSKFVNGSGLAAFVRSVMDVQMNLELGQPKIANGGLSAVVTERTPSLDGYMSHLEELYNQWKDSDGETKAMNTAIPLVISGVAKAATMDMRLIDPTLPDDPGSKVNKAIDNVVKFYRQEQERKGVQIVFADQYRQISTDYLDAFAGGSYVPPNPEDAAEETDAPAPDAGGFNLYADIKKKLVAKGIPADEIAIATEYETDEDRASLFAKANSGNVRVLLGSTYKLGVGVNVQERLFALHHLDAPWTPADLEQRIGRAWRAGNKYAQWGIPIQNLSYGVARTSDAGRYQVIETKSRFVKQAIEGKGGYEFDDPAGGLVDAAAELKAQFTGDPRVMEKVALENQIRSLEMARDAHENRKAQFQLTLSQEQATERDMRQKADEWTATKARLEAVAQKGLTPEQLDDINARLDIAKDAVLAAGVLQDEKARDVWSRILDAGVSMTVYAVGQLDAKNQPVFRASSVLSLDGQVFQDKGITSERASGIPEMFARAVARAESARAGALKSAEYYASKHAETRAELAREFPQAAELAEKTQRLAALDAQLEGKTEKNTPLADGRGPRGEMAPLASASGQLEFEYVTDEEIAQAERAIETATKAQLVRDNLTLANKIAAQFKIPGQEAADIRQEGHIGLVDAAKSYSPDLGAFAPYAGQVIRNRLRDLYKREIRRIRTQGISTDAANQEGATILDAASATDNTRQDADLAETRRLLSNAMAALPERLRGILEQRAQGASFETIGAGLGISKQRTQDLAKNAMAVVRAHLKRAGVKRLESDGVLASQSGQTETPEFKKWFGDSKVVDSKGKPLVVFHGTYREFDTFRPGRADAIYFSPNKTHSRGYGPFTIAAYLRIEKLADLTDPKSAAYKLAVKTFNENGGWSWNDDAMEERTSPNFDPKKDLTWEIFDNPEVEISEVLKNAGYDGLKLEEYEGEISYAVFDPTQIKSATANNGQFDRKNPSILKSASAVEEPPAMPQEAKLYAAGLGEKFYSLYRKWENDFADWVNKAPNMMPFQNGNGRVALVSRNVKKGEDAWRVTRFRPALDGGTMDPIGHEAFPTKREAYQAAIDFGGVMTPDLLFSSSAEDEQAIAELMKDLESGLDLDSVGRKLTEGNTQPDGQRTIGRPDLANPAGPDAASRNVVNAVDEARKETMERQKHEQWRNEAVAMIAKDRAGVLRDILAAANEGQALTNPVQVKAAQLLVNDLIQKAVASKDPVAMKQAQALAWSYREGGTEQARALAARRDPFKKPADRYREFLAGALFSPSPKLAKELKSTWSPADKQRTIAALRKQLAEAKAQTGSVEQQRNVMRLTREIGEAVQKKDRAELLNASLSERMKKIEAEFQKMGVTLDDMFAGEAYLRLRGQQIDNNVFDKANYSAVKKRALTLIKKGWSDAYIADKTGLTAAQVAGFYQEHVAALRARLEQLGDAALDPDKLDTLNLSAASANLASGSALTAAERAAKIDAMIAAMGYARNEVRQQRTKRAPARRTPKPAPAPAAPKPTATEPGKTPAYPTDATGKTDPYDFANEESAPPAFDISDPVQVAQVARVIQAINGNKFDMATEFWVNSVLSGPLTHAANIAGNTANTAWDFTFKRFGEATVNAMVQDANAPQMGEFRHMLRAVQPAISRAWRNTLRTWAAESPMFANDVLNQQLDLGAEFDKGGSPRVAIGGKTGKVVRIPGRLLMAADDFFKSFIAHVEAAAQGYRIAKSEGLAGDALEARIRGLVNLPGSAAWLAAVKKAEELTFQDRHDGTRTGDLLNKLTQLREADFGGGVKPLRFVLPFIRTPFNIFQQGLRQSPAGAGMLLARFAKAGFFKIKDGKPVAETYPRPEMIKHSVEQLIAWTLGAILYSAGAGDDDDEDKPILITGSVPYKNAGDNALNQRTANQPYSIRIGNTIIPYGRIEPAATILGTTMDAIRATKQAASKKDEFDGLGVIMQAIGQQAEEKTFLRGASDLIDALQGDRAGARSSWAANFIASWVPNVLRQPMRELDPYIRERGTGFAGQLAGNVVSAAGQVKADVYGNDVERPSLAAWRALVPVAIRSTPTVNRIDRAIVNWNQQNPKDPWAPSPVTRTVKIGKEFKQLNAAELREYAVRSGKLAGQILRNASFNIEHPTLADRQRIETGFSTARQIVRKQMFGGRAE